LKEEERAQGRKWLERKEELPADLSKLDNEEKKKRHDNFVKSLWRVREHDPHGSLGRRLEERVTNQL